MAESARLEFSHQGMVARLILSTPPANVLDKAMVGALRAALRGLLERRDLRAIVIEAEGEHFSYGASIEEHLPEAIDPALRRFRGLLEDLLRAPAPTFAAVRGRCLGGGLELALGCDLIVAEEDARIALPEIKLAVFPPAGAALLPARIGSGPATELVLGGGEWTGKRAYERGLATRTAPSGQLDAVVEAWIESDFLPRSAEALRQAVKAARVSAQQIVDEELPELERLYMEKLMKQPDAEEGIRAFLEKRPPRWSS